MAEKKLTLSEDGPRIEDFLDAVLDLGGFDLDFEVSEGETLHPDFENPDLVVRFTGADVDLLLANKAELLLALEQLTMEALRMAPEDHSRVCFDANDHRMLRIQELRMSAQAAADRVKKTQRAVPLQPHEQPGAAHPASGPARGNRSAQRKRRRRADPPGGDRPRRYEDAAGADPASAPAS